ncbi:MAG: DUF4296 domain-containing protein [Paludibacter sp.]|nr:DUF4296 domain-containing protein [Paludibacter sp.]
MNPKSSTLHYLICFTFFTFVMISCNNRPSVVINQGKMVSFLTDLHKLDGALSVKGLGATQDRENIYYYNALLLKYGITKDQFDSSLVWYTKNPKKFEKIYVKVLLHLNEEDSVVKKRIMVYEDSIKYAIKRFNLWNKPVKMLLTKDSARTSVDFEIVSTELFSQDIYELKFLHRIAPSDSCLNQRSVFRIHFANGETDSIFTNTHNDSVLRRYKLRLVARYNLKVERLTGSLLGSSTYKGVQNALLDSISLIHEFSPKTHEKMRLELKQLKADSIKIDSLQKIDSLHRRLPHMPRSNKFIHVEKLPKSL